MHLEDQLALIDEKVDRALRLIAHIIGKEKLIMATLDQVLENVAAQTSRIDSLNVLMDGIRQQLADVLSGTVIPPQVQAKIDAIFDVAQTNAAKIEEAITENTPVTPPPPEEPTV